MMCYSSTSSKINWSDRITHHDTCCYFSVSARVLTREEVTTAAEQDPALAEQLADRLMVSLLSLSHCFVSLCVREWKRGWAKCQCLVWFTKSGMEWKMSSKFSDHTGSISFGSCDCYFVFTLDNIIFVRLHRKRNYDFVLCGIYRLDFYIKQDTVL